MQIYIISCNNLANTYEKLDAINEAEDILKRVVYYLLHIINNNKINIEEGKSELKKAIITYNYFLDKNDIIRTKQKKLFSVVKEQLL